MIDCGVHLVVPRAQLFPTRSFSAMATAAICRTKARVRGAFLRYRAVWARLHPVFLHEVRTRAVCETGSIATVLSAHLPGAVQIGARIAKQSRPTAKHHRL